MLSQRDETGSGTPIIISATRPHVMDASDRKKVKTFIFVHTWERRKRATVLLILGPFSYIIILV